MDTLDEPRVKVAHEEQSRIFDDSMHAPSICFDTIQAPTHVLLALACQQSMIHAHHRLRLTMQHVLGYGANLVTNAPIVLLPLAHLGSSLATMSSHVDSSQL